MIGMQYRLVLPTDYDMGIIERRIAERGHLTDGFRGLAFKAYLLARKDGTTAVPDNAYAPFYVWNETEGMNDFLCGPGFQGLAQAFGRPAVRTWSVWRAVLSAGIATARHASVTTTPIPRHADLAALRRAESAYAERLAADDGVLAAVAGFDPSDWSLVRFQLRDARPETPADGATLLYEVGHVSTG